MAIVTLSCPHCGFSKDLNNTSIPPIGTKVTCPTCRGSFSYFPAQEEVSIVPSRDLPDDRPPVKSSALPPLPPKLPTPRIPLAAVPKISSNTKKRDLRIILAIIIPVSLVFFYGLSFLYTKITVQLEAEEWNALGAITAFEQNERDGILSKSESLLLASNYDELDKIADEYRSKKVAFTDGEWKLSVLYDGMSYYLRQAPEDNWVNRLDNLKGWVSAKPNSITARVALAECLVGYAFHGRSYAYANEVKEDQWKHFEERLEEAALVLEQAKNLQQVCPGWWAAYQRIALGGSLDKTQYDDFLESAIAYEPTYNVFYFRTAWHLLPRWFGEEGDWEQFATSIADRVGGPDGDILYTRIVWFMDRRAPGKVVYKNPKIMWQRVNNGIKLIKMLNGK